MNVKIEIRAQKIIQKIMNGDDLERGDIILIDANKKIRDYIDGILEQWIG